MIHFSIRSYSRQLLGHSHDYHQLVLPLHGTISISVGAFSGRVSAGDCVIIKSGVRHDFSAVETARFLVVDCKQLPENIMRSAQEKIAVNSPLLAYIQFIEQQLQYQVNPKLESLTFALFFQLLGGQVCANRIDKRIEKVLELICADLSQAFRVEVLAQTACLSATQFKKVFKQSMGASVQSYITGQRMNKAKALLTHTDIPVSLVAERTGYQNASAFSRRFKCYFGVSPRTFVH